MSFWVLLQVLVDVILFAGASYLWVRAHRQPKDDPRLSRGLQLLQSKISVLEDLSDRTEHQVSQINALIDQRVKDIQNKIQASEKSIQAIDASMNRSLEVAKIFQDRIPHQEIIERQNTIKYVKAARLAHQGVSPDEIARVVDLSRGEIDFISKVNRQQLQFSETDLPDWIKEELGDFMTTAPSAQAQPVVAPANSEARTNSGSPTHPGAQMNPMPGPQNQAAMQAGSPQPQPNSSVFTQPTAFARSPGPVDNIELSQLGEKFRSMVGGGPSAPAVASPNTSAPATPMARSAAPGPAAVTTDRVSIANAKDSRIKKFEFPRLN